MVLVFCIGGWVGLVECAEMQWFICQLTHFFAFVSVAMQ